MLDYFGEINPVLLVALVLGMVEFAKRLGVSGQASLGLSMALGIAFGVLSQVGELFPTISPWFEIGVYGLLMGLAASGLYDLGKRFTQ